MAESVLNLNRSDFNAAIRELADQGMDTTFLRQKYREQNSPFSGLLDYANRQQQRIEDAGRRPIMGGLLSKPVDATGMDAITQAEFEPAAFISGLLSGGAQAVDAPAAAMRGDLTGQDAENAALNTAGMAMLGGGLTAKPAGALGANSFRQRQLSVEDAPMIVQHNISPEGLAISEQIGGIPMPSIGIAGAKAPLEGFGDITLMLNPEKIAPRRDLPVYPADAYTGRQPRADVEFANKSLVEDAIAADPNFNHMRDKDYWMQSYDNFADNDRMMRTAQFGIDNKIANPKDYESFDDYVRDVQRKSGGFLYEEQLAPYAGLREYGDTQLMLSPEDPFTPSGNRRASKPYTVEDAFKRMNKNKASQAGSEGHSGPGLMRAVLLDKFKNLDDIKANRGLLMASGNEMEDVKGAWGSVVYDTIEDVASKHFEGSHRRAEEYMTDLAMGRNVSWANATSEARSAATKALAELKKEAAGMPTEYFEAKPRSVARIGDFDAAVVPEGSVEALEALRRAGIQNIKTYNPDVPGRTRADVIGGMDDFFFANASTPAGLLAGQMSSEEQRAIEDYLKGLQPQGLLGGAR